MSGSCQQGSPKTPKIASAQFTLRGATVPVKTQWGPRPCGPAHLGPKHEHMRSGTNQVETKQVHHRHPTHRKGHGPRRAKGIKVGPRPERSADNNDHDNGNNEKARAVHLDVKQSPGTQLKKVTKGNSKGRANSRVLA